MADEYTDFFIRIQDCISAESRKRTTWQIFDRDKDGHTEKLINLFVDCFDHHTQMADRQPVKKLTLLSKKDRRYIPRDELHVKFLDEYYTPPTILKNPYILPPYRLQDTISFNDLCTDIQSNPITSDPNSTIELGSNTYTYLIGDVGIGKSLFIMAAYRHIIYQGGQKPYEHKDESGYTIVPIYINVDEGNVNGSRLAEIDSGWFDKYIVNEIIDRFRASAELETRSQINNFDDPKGTGYANRMRKLTQFLAKNKYRIVLLVDNVDRYHFHYSKYRFSTKYKFTQRDSVINSLKKMISCFTSRRELGWCGLCIVFVCRDYVYDYLRIGCTDPSEKEREFGRAHKLVLQGEQQVMQTRLALFKAASERIPESDIGELGSDYLDALRAVIDFPMSPGELRPEIKLILRLGNHGYRSLVEFLDRLEFNLANKVVFERLLQRQRKNLPTLYILNLLQRYSQKSGHFPNIFLVDARISVPEEFADAHPKHRPTYWLKYLILKFIVKFKTRRLSQIIRLFSDVGDYDEDLVRLAVGSLCSTNDSRCLDVDASGEVAGLTDPEVFATERGKQLVSSSSAFGDADVDFCFEFNYLQLMVDDIWLSVPEKWAHEVAVELNYDYLVDSTDKYGGQAWEMVKSKSLSTIAFMSILSASLRHEMKRMTGLRNALINHSIMPDVNTARESLYLTCVELYRIFNRPADDEKELERHFNKWKLMESDLDSFFETVQKKNLMVN